MSPSIPAVTGTLVAVRHRPDRRVATFVREDGSGLVAFVCPGTLAVVVCDGQDRFGRRMTMALVVQPMLVWVYNEDLEEVTQ